MSKCEWWPRYDKPAELATDGSHHGCQFDAVVCVGARGQWHLCAECASLPRFKRFRRRRSLLDVRLPEPEGRSIPLCERCNHKSVLHVLRAGVRCECMEWSCACELYEPPVDEVPA